jgi:hypothetical protein
MLRIDRGPSPLTVGMLRIDREPRQLDPEPQPLDPESQQLGLHSEHIGSKPRPLSFNSEHLGLKRLPRQVWMLRKSGVFLPHEPGPLRLGRESQHPPGDRDSNVGEGLAPSRMGGGPRRENRWTLGFPPPGRGQAPPLQEGPESGARLLRRR